MTIVTIIGSGLMGTATAYPLSDNGHDIRLVGTHLDVEIIESCKTKGYHPKLKRMLPPGVKSFFVEEIEEALHGANVIVSGVNSLGVHWIGKILGSYIKPGQKIIAITKGLEATNEGELIILPDVMKNEFPETKRDQVFYAAVGGPCIAGELAGHRHSLVYFGSRDEKIAKDLAKIFQTPYYHVFTTSDLESLEYSAALKNAYTLAVGLAYGILEKSGGVDDAGASMHNLAAGIFGFATNEISRILFALGLNSDLAHHLPGAGDLFVTVTGGRTVRFARLLGLGHTLNEAKKIMAGETLEALHIIQTMAKVVPSLKRSGVLDNSGLPLMEMLINIVVEDKKVDTSLDSFFENVRSF